MTHYEKGARAEREYKTMKEELGFWCVRAAGSHGLWDVVGISKDGGFLASVRSYKQKQAWTKKELEELKRFNNHPKGFIKLKVLRRLGGLWVEEEI